MSELIIRIQNAISAEKVTLQQLNVERSEVLRVLYHARFVDAEDIHHIESRFAEKIGNTAHNIENMERHIAELEESA